MYLASFEKLRNGAQSSHSVTVDAQNINDITTRTVSWMVVDLGSERYLLWSIIVWSKK